MGFGNSKRLICVCGAALVTFTQLAIFESEKKCPHVHTAEYGVNLQMFNEIVAATSTSATAFLYHLSN